MSRRRWQAAGNANPAIARCQPGSRPLPLPPGPRSCPAPPRRPSGALACPAPPRRPSGALAWPVAADPAPAGAPRPPGRWHGLPARDPSRLALPRPLSRPARRARKSPAQWPGFRGGAPGYPATAEISRIGVAMMAVKSAPVTATVPMTARASIIGLSP